MDRRSFIKAIPAIAAGAALFPAQTFKSVQKSPASSILLLYGYPGDSNRHGLLSWTTPTIESYRKAKDEASKRMSKFSGWGYDVELHEFDTIRLVNGHA